MRSAAGFQTTMAPSAPATTIASPAFRTSCSGSNCPLKIPGPLLCQDDSVRRSTALTEVWIHREAPTENPGWKVMGAFGNELVKRTTWKCWDGYSGGANAGATTK